MGDKILVERTGFRADITFNNPEKHNAVSLEMWQAFAEALNTLANDPELRVLVLKGAGDKSFVSGADISKFEDERANQEAIARYEATTGKVFDNLETFPKPVICRVQGYCVGGGLNLAATSDLRIASTNAKFAMPAAKLGLGYGFKSVRRLADVMGATNALEMAYTARLFSGEEALRMGFVNQLVTHEELDALVDEYVSRICVNAPLTLQAFKASAIALRTGATEHQLAHIQGLVETCFQSQDYVEGRAAFVEKRPPQFRGQ